MLYAIYSDEEDLSVIVLPVEGILSSSLILSGAVWLRMDKPRSLNEFNRASGLRGGIAELKDNKLKAPQNLAALRM